MLRIYKICFVIIYLVMLVLIKIQYIRVEKNEKELLGFVREDYRKHYWISIGCGMLLGIGVSLLMKLVSFEVDVRYFNIAFLLSILFFFIKPRYACIAYSGSIACLIGSVMQFDIHSIRSVMYIVALMHLVEGVLITIDGYKLYLPIYLERNKELVGGFRLCRFWCVPMFILIKNIGFIPIAAMLAYSDISLDLSPKDNAKMSSRMLVYYSLSLIIAISLSYIYIYLIYVAVIMSPLLHELIILKRKRDRTKRIPWLTISDRGVRILDVFENSIAKLVGMEYGDEVIKINDKIITCKQDIENELRNSRNLCISYYSYKEKRLIIKKVLNNSNKKLGILVLTDDVNYISEEIDRVGMLKKVARKLLKQEKL